MEAKLAEREYWRPGECVAVLGRSAAYWIGLYDRGVVAGYEEEGRRYLEAASARAHLKRLQRASNRTPASDPVQAGIVARDVMRAFRERVRAGEFS